MGSVLDRAEAGTLEDVGAVEGNGLVEYRGGREYKKGEYSSVMGGACGCCLDIEVWSVPATVAEEGEDWVVRGSERENQQLALSRAVTYRWLLG